VSPVTLDDNESVNSWLEYNVMWLIGPADATKERDSRFTTTTKLFFSHHQLHPTRTTWHSEQQLEVGRVTECVAGAHPDSHCPPRPAPARAIHTSCRTIDAQCQHQAAQHLVQLECIDYLELWRSSSQVNSIHRHDFFTSRHFSTRSPRIQSSQSGNTKKWNGIRTIHSRQGRQLG
jgi:hypothetical protein